jgi:hypothetical protein
VSSFLRYETYDPQLFVDTPGFVRLHAMASSEMEEAILESLIHVYQNPQPDMGGESVGSPAHSCCAPILLQV